MLYPLLFEIAHENISKDMTKRRSHSHTINLIKITTIEEWFFFVANSSNIFKTVGGMLGGIGREYHLEIQICMVSSSGTFVKRVYKIIFFMPVRPCPISKMNRNKESS